MATVADELIIRVSANDTASAALRGLRDLLQSFNNTVQQMSTASAAALQQVTSATQQLNQGLGTLATGGAAHVHGGLGGVQDQSALTTEALTSLGAAVGELAVQFLELSSDRARQLEDKLVSIERISGLSKDGMEQLKDSIITLGDSLRRPVAQIAAAYEEAARLGLKGDDLIRFVQTVDKFSIATAISADDAARALANIRNIYSQQFADVTKLENFASAVVWLDSSTASTAAKIIEGMRRVVSAVELKLDPTFTASMIAHLTAMGTAAEAAGTQVESALNFLMKPKQFEKAAAFMRISLQDFKQMLERDAQGTIMALLRQIGQLPSAVERMQIAFNLFGMVGKKAMSKMSQDVAGLEREVQGAKRAFDQNTDATRALDMAMSTASSAAARFNNSVWTLQATFGERLLPIEKQVYGWLQTLVIGMRNVIKETGLLATAIMSLTSVAGLGLLFGGTSGMAAVKGFLVSVAAGLTRILGLSTLLGTPGSMMAAADPFGRLKILMADIFSVGRIAAFVARLGLVLAVLNNLTPALEILRRAVEPLFASDPAASAAKTESAWTKVVQTLWTLLERFFAGAFEAAGGLVILVLQGVEKIEHALMKGIVLVLHALQDGLPKAMGGGEGGVFNRLANNMLQALKQQEGTFAQAGMKTVLQMVEGAKAGLRGVPEVLGAMWSGELLTVLNDDAKALEDAFTNRIANSLKVAASSPKLREVQSQIHSLVEANLMTEGSFRTIQGALGDNLPAWRALNDELAKGTNAGQALRSVMATYGDQLGLTAKQTEQLASSTQKAAAEMSELARTKQQLATISAPAAAKPLTDEDAMFGMPPGIEDVLKGTQHRAYIEATFQMERLRRQREALQTEMFNQAGATRGMVGGQEVPLADLSTKQRAALEPLLRQFNLINQKMEETGRVAARAGASVATALRAEGRDYEAFSREVQQNAAIRIETELNASNKVQEAHGKVGTSVKRLADAHKTHAATVQQEWQKAIEFVAKYAEDIGKQIAGTMATLGEGIKAVSSTIAANAPNVGKLLDNTQGFSFFGEEMKARYLREYDIREDIWAQERKLTEANLRNIELRNALLASGKSMTYNIAVQGVPDAHKVLVKSVLDGILLQAKSEAGDLCCG